MDTKWKYYTFSVTPLTHKSLSSFQFKAKDIKGTLNKLVPTKADDHDIISVCMIKLCGDSVHKPLEMIFKSFLNQGMFPTELKKVNIVPVDKKGDHQCVKNYRSISLLPVLAKMFERLIFKHFLDNLILFLLYNSF